MAYRIEHPTISRIVWWLLGVGFVLLLIQLMRRSSSDAINEQHFNATLDQLLLPRWLSSVGHDQIAYFLIKELSTQGFTTTYDEVWNELPYTNVVGIMNPQAKQFLLLSCHYDSKYLDTSEEYVSATDGAVSCAILLNMAKKLNYFLHNEFAHNPDLGLVVSSKMFLST